MRELNEAAEKAKQLFVKHERQPVGDWISYTHPDVPDEPEEERRDKIKSICMEDSQMKHHCLGCLVTSGCYFIKGEKTNPQYHEHPNCHCTQGKYAPVAIAAISPIDKFVEYLFAEKHAWRGKRYIFEDVFGYSIEDSEKLRKEYERQGKEKYVNGDYKLKELKIYGQYINIQIELNTPKKGRVTVVSGWNVNSNGNISLNTPMGENEYGKIR